MAGWAIEAILAVLTDRRLLAIAQYYPIGGIARLHTTRFLYNFNLPLNDSVGCHLDAAV